MRARPDRSPLPPPLLQKTHVRRKRALERRPVCIQVFELEHTQAAQGRDGRVGGLRGDEELCVGKEGEHRGVRGHSMRRTRPPPARALCSLSHPLCLCVSLAALSREPCKSESRPSAWVGGGKRRAGSWRARGWGTHTKRFSRPPISHPSSPPFTCISCISSDRNSSMPMVPDMARPRARAASPGRADADAMENGSTTGRPREGWCAGGGGAGGLVSSRGSGTRRRRGSTDTMVESVRVGGRGGEARRARLRDKKKMKMWKTLYFSSNSTPPAPSTQLNASRRGLPPGPGGHDQLHPGLVRRPVVGPRPGRRRRPDPPLLCVRRGAQEDAAVRHARGGGGCVLFRRGGVGTWMEAMAGWSR